MPVKDLVQHFGVVADPRCGGKIEHRLTDGRKRAAHGGGGMTFMHCPWGRLPAFAGVTGVFLSNPIRL